MAIWTPTSAGNGTSLAVDSYGRTGTAYGSDALDTDNPEIVASDDTQVDLNFFSSGVHAYTKWSGGSDAWTDIGVVLQRTAGVLGPGAPGGLAEVRIKKRFLLDAIEDYSGGAAAHFVAIAGPGVLAANAKNTLKVVHVSGTGASSVWRFEADWERYSTGGGQTASSANIPYADLEVDTDRDILYRVQGCTAAQTDFSGAILNGSILVEMDGVELINATGIDPYIHWQSGAPAVRDTFQRIGLGFAGLLGPVWPISISDEATDDPAGPFPQDYSTECCAGSASPGTSSTGAPSGDPTRSLQPWTVQCTGGGTVPSESDPSAAEAWA